MTAQKILRECEIFAALQNADLEKIAGFSLEKQYEAGTTILTEGDEAEELLLIQEGKVALQIVVPKSLTHMGRRVTVEILGKNEILGWSALVEPYVNMSTAICLHRVEALSLNGTKLRWLLQDNPVIGYGILKQLIKLVVLKLRDTRYLLITERFLPPKLE